MTSLRDGASGKALALAIGMLVLGAIHLAVIAPLLSYYESTAQRLQERQELVRRYQASARDLPRLREAAMQRREQTPDGDLLLTGSTDAVAAATLQSALKDLVEQEGAKLTSAEMLPLESKDNAAKQVGVRIAFLGNLELITAVLEGVEMARPLLSVGNLAIHDTDSPNEEDAGRTLAIVMDVHGFLSQ